MKTRRSKQPRTGAEAEAQGRRDYRAAASTKPRQWSSDIDPATIPNRVIASELARRKLRCAQ